MPLKMLIHLRRQTLLIEEMLGIHLNLREGLKILIVVKSPVTAIRRSASFWLNLVPPQDGFGGVLTDLQSVFVPEVGRESAVPVAPPFGLQEDQGFEVPGGPNIPKEGKENLSG